MLRKIYRYFSGYDLFRIPAVSFVRAIEALRSSGLQYIDMDAAGDTVVLSVPFFTAQKIRMVFASEKIEFQEEMRGLPRILHRYRRRVGIPLGALILTISLIVSSRYIWCFEITGNETMTAEEVVAGLTELGCGIGARIKTLDIDDIENKFALYSDNAAWISVNVKGTTARVEVREIYDAESQNKEGKCANLVAAESGEIVYVDVSNGRAVLKAGDVVKAGELLVSGINESKSGKWRYEYAEGAVMARVTRLIRVEISPHIQEKVYTGRETVEREVNIFGKVINLFGKGGNAGTNCDMISVSEKFSFFRDETLPVHVTTNVYREYETVDKTISESEAAAAGLTELRHRMDEALLDAELLEKNITADFIDGVYVVECRLYVLTDIAETREVPVLTDEEKDGAEGNQRTE